MEKLDPQTINGMFALFGVTVVVVPVVVALTVARSIEGLKWGFLMGVIAANALVYLLGSPHLIVLAATELIALLIIAWVYLDRGYVRHVITPEGESIEHGFRVATQAENPVERVVRARGDADRGRLEGAAALVDAQVGMAEQSRLLEHQRQQYYLELAAQTSIAQGQRINPRRSAEGSWREMPRGSNDESK